MSANLKEAPAEMAAADGRVYVGADCTLDGERAIVCGRLNDFATVAALPHGNRVEYAWQTVARVMAAGGAFGS